MRSISASALAALLPLTALAQGPVLQSSVPGRHSFNGSRTAPVQLTFSQPVTNPAAIRVNTNQHRGYRAGTFAGAGTSQVSFQPAQPFAPGELVSVTVPTSVSTPARVVEFRAAAAPGLATFSSPLIIGPASNPPANAVAGDIDNDGDLDLVASEVGNVSIYRNNGSGQFTASQAGQVAAASAGDLLLADVNGDGNLDLLSSSNSQAGVYLSLGTGTGTFQARTVLQSVALPSQLVTGDFNADGLVDVVVGEATATGMTLHFIPGASSGPLAATRSTPVAFNMRDLGVADMDEDGDLDLVAVSDIQLTMCLNDGSGQFTLGATTIVNQSSMRLTVGDFTGDGHADVACSSYQTANVSLVPGNGAGGWEPMRSVPALSRTWHVRAGDMDGDADLDMLVTNDRGITQVMLNNGNGTFAPAASVLIGWEQFTMADAADLNGDGVLDVYAGNGTSNPAGPHGINIFFNQPRVTATKSSVAPLAFTAFPNPARGEVYLQLPAGTAATTVELRDALGRLVRTLPAAQVATRILPLNDLAPGRYAVLTYTKQARGAQWIVVE